MAKWKRKCPECGKDLSYTRKDSRNYVENRNTNCLSCTMIGKPGYWKGKNRSEEVRGKISESLKGIKCSEETRKKMRLSANKRIENWYGQIVPNSNPKATQIIRAKAKELGITDLRDAETPDGEFQVCGYFVDGRSKEKNIVFEYYEKAHERTKERDERRKREIIKELGCKFIEIWE